MAERMLIGVTEARDNIARLVDEAEDRDVMVLRRNKPVAVIVHPDRLEKLVDRVEDLEDYVAALEAKLEPGDTVPHEDVVRRRGSKRAS